MATNEHNIKRIDPSWRRAVVVIEEEGDFILLMKPRCEAKTVPTCNYIWAALIRYEMR